VIPDKQSSGLLDWQHLLSLGEQLVNLNSVLAQRDLVVTTTRQWIGGVVSLYLADSAYPLPGQNENGFTTLPPEGLARQALDSRQEQRHPDLPPGDPSIDAVAFPLISQDTLIGVLQVIHSPDDPLDRLEQEVIRALASVAAANMQIYRQSVIKNWRFEQLALVRSVSFQIANVLDLDELARRVTRLILHTFRYYYVAIFTLAPGQKSLQFRASCRYSAPNASSVDSDSSFPVNLGDGIVGFVAQTGDELVACKVGEEPRYRFIETLPETRSECAFPLKIGERVLGVLDVQSDQPDAFHESEILVLRALADNIALAVEGARLYNAIEHRANQIAMVAEASRAITSILDLDSLLKQVVDLIHIRFGYPYVHLFTVAQDGESMVFQSGSGSRAESIQAAEISYRLSDQKGIIPWVARQRRFFMSNDVSADPLYRPNPLAPTGTRAELALPLVFGDEILGVLDIQSDLTNVFDLNDRPVFEALADSVAIAIHNAKVYQDELWRRQVAESLRDVAWMLTAGTDQDKVLEAILIELEKNLITDCAAIWLFEEIDPNINSRPMLKLASIRGRNLPDLEQIKVIDSEADFNVARTLKADQPIIRSPQDPFGPLGAALGFPQDYSSISVPLRAGDQSLGIIAVIHHSSGRYTDKSQAMIATFASYAAVAIENSRLYASAQKQAWISTVLLQVAEATQSLTTIDDLVSTVVRLTPLLLGVKGCALFLWNEETQTFDLKASYGLTAVQEAKYKQRSIPIGATSAFDRLFNLRQPVLITDPVEEIKLEPELLDDLEVNVLILIPFLAHAELLGALLISLDSMPYANEELSASDDERLAIIQGISQQTAVAIQNIRLLESKQEEAYVTAVLLQVAQTMVSMNNLDDIFETIIQILPILVGIDCSIIYTWDTGRQLFYPSRAYHISGECDEAFYQQVFPAGRYPMLDAVWNNEAPVIARLDIPSEPVCDWPSLSILTTSEDQRELLKTNSGLLMGLPLSVKGEKYGVMLAADSGSQGIRQRRLEILSGVSQQVSLAIQNDRLQKEMVGRERTEREFQLAREIQRTFLPTHIPTFPGWDIDVRWRTARQVGGDFYDFIDLPDGRLGLVIADVSDKGLAAALYMTVTRTLIRASVLEIDSPARVLEHVNDTLLINSQNGLFVTAFYAILDLEKGCLTYANAGHNLPLVVCQQTGQVGHLEHGGIALGALGKIELVDHQWQLQPGDCLVLFTDGATETFSPAGEIYGDERLHSVLQSADISSARSVLDQIDADLAHFRQDEPINDDITLLVVKHLPHINP
jgi:sigma-B regulation protein RsbU (phosphoserine phosphatase)